MKEQTIKHLKYLIFEIENNMLGMKMDKEDLEHNEKVLQELYNCVNWVKNKKIK